MEKRVKSQALEKFVHNKRAVFGVIVVLVIALCCLLLPLVMDLDPYTTDELAGFNSHRQNIFSAPTMSAATCLPACCTAAESRSLSALPPPSSAC